MDDEACSCQSESSLYPSADASDVGCTVEESTQVSNIPSAIASSCCISRPQPARHRQTCDPERKPEDRGCECPQGICESGSSTALLLDIAACIGVAKDFICHLLSVCYSWMTETNSWEGRRRHSGNRDCPHRKKTNKFGETTTRVQTCCKTVIPPMDRYQKGCKFDENRHNQKPIKTKNTQANNCLAEKLCPQAFHCYQMDVENNIINPLVYNAQIPSPVQQAPEAAIHPQRQVQVNRPPDNQPTAVANTRTSIRGDDRDYPNIDVGTDGCTSNRRSQRDPQDLEPRRNRLEAVSENVRRRELINQIDRLENTFDRSHETSRERRSRHPQFNDYPDTDRPKGSRNRDPTDQDDLRNALSRSDKDQRRRRRGQRESDPDFMSVDDTNDTAFERRRHRSQPPAPEDQDDSQQAQSSNCRRKRDPLTRKDNSTERVNDTRSPSRTSKNRKPMDKAAAAITAPEPEMPRRRNRSRAPEPQSVENSAVIYPTNANYIADPLGLSIPPAPQFFIPFNANQQYPLQAVVAHSILQGQHAMQPLPSTQPRPYFNHPFTISNPHGHSSHPPELQMDMNAPVYIMQVLPRGIQNHENSPISRQIQGSQGQPPDQSSQLNENLGNVNSAGGSSGYESDDERSQEDVHSRQRSKRRNTRSRGEKRESRKTSRNSDESDTDASDRGNRGRRSDAKRH